MQLYSGSLTLNISNAAHACCFVPALYDSGIRKTITDVYCDADDIYANNYSLCFENGLTESGDVFNVYVRDERGQWYMSEETTLLALTAGDNLDLEMSECSNPHEDSGNPN